MFLSLTLGAASVDAAEVPPVPDTFTATTTAMTPSGVTLKIDVKEWSDEAARQAAVAALGESDVGAALKEVPTVGYVWRSGSAVGYSLKYAHRVTDERGERVTFVTDRLLGTYGLKPWAVDGSSAAGLQYSVIELYLGGNGAGTGNLSLAADVALDASSGVISLTPKPGTAPVLSNAKSEPKPYWVTDR